MKKTLLVMLVTLLTLLLALGVSHAEGLIAAVCLYLFGMGMSLPQSQAGALLPLSSMTR